MTFLHVLQELFCVELNGVIAVLLVTFSGMETHFRWILEQSIDALNLLLFFTDNFLVFLPGELTL